MKSVQIVEYEALEVAGSPTSRWTTLAASGERTRVVMGTDRMETTRVNGSLVERTELVEFTADVTAAKRRNLIGRRFANTVTTGRQLTRLRVLQGDVMVEPDVIVLVMDVKQAVSTRPGLGKAAAVTYAIPGTSYGLVLPEYPEEWLGLCYYAPRAGLSSVVIVDTKAGLILHPAELFKRLDLQRVQLEISPENAFRAESQRVWF